MFSLLVNIILPLLNAAIYSETPAKFITSESGITTLAPFWQGSSTSLYPSLALPLISSSSDLREYQKSVIRKCVWRIYERSPGVVS
jgi:hypothetical protein